MSLESGCNIGKEADFATYMLPLIPFRYLKARNSVSADSASESDGLLASSGTDTDPAADIRSLDTPSGADTAQRQILRVEILPWKLMKPRVMYLCQRRVQNVECLPRKA